jgi:hypothetical protein
MKFSSIVKFFFLRVINMKDRAARHIIIFLLLINSLTLFPQDGSFKPSRAEAEAAWISGNYETALQHYNGLLLIYSRDPVYKYYTGSCLVKLERDAPRAVTLLASAINSSVNIKTVPDDVWFYYGRALQMTGSFSMASDAFGRFVRTAGKKASQAMEVQKYITQCDMRKGAISMEHGERALRNSPPAGGHFSEQTDSAVAGKEQPVSEITDTGQPVIAKTQAEQPFSVPEEYDSKLTGAVKMQYAADSLNRLAQGLRREMETSTVKEPLLLRAEKLEKEAAAMQAKADRIFLTLEPSDKVETKVATKSETGAEEKDEAKVKAQAEAEKKNEAQAEDKIQGKNQKEAVFSVLEVRTSPAYTSNEQIPMGTGAPQGLVYRIQLAAFKNPLPPGYFKGLYPLYGKINSAKGLTYYYTGMFRTLESARQSLPKVRNAGFNDAFVIAMMDDVQISMERALLLEKEWSGNPLYFNDPAPGGTENISGADPLPVGTLSFRAEVLRSKKPLTPELTQKIALLSGSRGLDIIKNNQGETLYLIGKFITFESAEEYVSLLVRNGYSTARVAAYVGTQEIPVESAKELLKKLLND